MKKFISVLFNEKESFSFNQTLCAISIIVALVVIALSLFGD